jgi:tRNA(fMet)-specific endonuclease VapC
VIYLLDTDHCTVLQRGGAGYDTLVSRLGVLHSDDFGTTIVSYEEQCRGWADRIHRASTAVVRVEAYARLQESLVFFSGIAVWEYSANADRKFEELVKAKVRAGTKDLRIAAIALTNGATLLTRNTQDFSRVPDLVIADWTI